MKKVTMEELLGVLKNIQSSISVVVEDLKTDVPLTEQGLDSMDTVNILFEIEDNFQTTIPDEAFRSGQLSTLEQILESINGNR